MAKDNRNFDDSDFGDSVSYDDSFNSENIDDDVLGDMGYEGGSSVDRYYDDGISRQWDREIDDTEFDQGNFDPNIASLARDDDNIFVDDDFYQSRSFNNDYDDDDDDNYSGGFLGLPWWLAILLFLALTAAISWAVWFTQFKDSDDTNAGGDETTSSSSENGTTSEDDEAILPPGIRDNDQAGVGDGLTDEDGSNSQGTGDANKDLKIANDQISKLKETNSMLSQDLESVVSESRNNRVTKTTTETKERTVTSTRRSTETITRRVTPTPRTRTVTREAPARTNTVTVTSTAPAPAPEYVTVTEVQPTTITKVEVETIWRRIR